MKKMFLLLLCFLVITGCSLDPNKEHCNKYGHEYNKFIVTVEPTCTTSGEKERSCIFCGYKDIRPISPIDHSYDDGTVSLEPTCTENGIKTYSCIHPNCDNFKTEDIPANGHSFDEGVITLQPTCIETGIKTFSCKNCNYKEDETFPPTGHEYHGIKCSHCKNYLVTLREIGVTYKTQDKLDLTLNSFTYSFYNGYHTYSINYSETNNNYGSIIEQGTFKIIYLKDGEYSSDFQTGFFGDVYYPNSRTRSYNWTLSADEEFVCLEYIPYSQTYKYIFSTTPTDELLNWIVK